MKHTTDLINRIFELQKQAAPILSELERLQCELIEIAAGGDIDAETRLKMREALGLSKRRA